MCESTVEGFPIYSRDHFVISVAVGLVAGLYAGVDLLTGLGWVAFAAVVGVGIDFDHFLVAWYNTGEPRAIRYCLRHPRAVFTDQAAIFHEYELGKLDRLLSHVLIGGPLVAALWVLAPPLALLAAATLYAHVVADLAQDIRDVRETNAPLG
ncbi:hypothetical protein [Haloarcula laminariae]|uniref:hypothetical protein n=1 Tax=Haloarcula laminariae TaxID=2961577 RepID=UPI0021CA7889|nr:hypothetical protein [Halomicroarcula laminariae]